MILDPIHIRPRRPVRACLGIRINHTGRGDFSIAHAAGDMPRDLALMVANLSSIGSLS